MFNLMFHENPRFSQKFKCYSVSMLPGHERQDVEKGGKIIMPPSALDQLTRFNVEYPMLFKLSNSRRNRISHAGVLEFVADEGKVYLPYWMMKNLLLDEGDLVQIESIALPVATFSKFQPQTTDFLDITNPKAVLENALRNFACLTTGDSIAIIYNNRVYELCVLETRPGNAVTIIECDMNVEFEAPVDYKDPRAEEHNKKQIEPEEPMDEIEEDDKTTFRGEGVRLDGKKKKDNAGESTTTKKAQTRGIPDYNHPNGLIRFNRNIKPISDRVNETKEQTDDDSEDTFLGSGFSLKKGRK